MGKVNQDRHADRYEKAIAIRQATDDGDNLDQIELEMVEHAVNNNQSELGWKFFYLTYLKYCKPAEYQKISPDGHEIGLMGSILEDLKSKKKSILSITLIIWITMNNCFLLFFHFQTSIFFNWILF